MRLRSQERQSAPNAQNEKAPVVFYVGDFKKSFSTENYVVHGLRACGAEVIVWQEDRQAPLDALIDEIIQCNPSFVLLSKNRLYSGGLYLVNRLRDAHIKTVSWLWDLYHDLPVEMGSVRRTSDSPFKADKVFMSDGGIVVPNKITLRQGIHEPEALQLKPIERFDVAFIGTNTYAERNRLIQFLRFSYGERFRHYGVGGDYPEVRGLELNQVLANAKVVVGDSVPSNNYWSNRVYEVIGRGGFLLHPRVKGLEQEFKYYKHFIPYDYGNFQQIKEIVDYFISHDKEREAIRDAGFNFCKENYTYTLRCQTLLQKVIGMSELKAALV